MHIADISMFYAAEGGGVSSYLNAKGRWLAHHGGMRHSILSPNIAAADRTPGRIHLPSIPFPGIHGYRMPLSISACARVLGRLRPDLIEVGDAGHGAWAALRVRDARALPVVGFYHSDLPSLVERRLGSAARGGARRYLARLYSQCDLVLAPSRLMVAQLADIGIRAVHQPLGIDSTIFRPAFGVCSLRDKLNLAPGARLLVYAGRFTAEKKLGLLVDAIKLLGAPYHLLLIGGGRRIAPDRAITRMPFCRDQRMLARLLSGCDALVHPGDCETFGLIVLEAMACGLPVVATGGAVAELVNDANGLIVRPDSAASLADGITALYEGDRAALAAVSRHRASAYDWQRIMPQLLGRYATLLARGPFGVSAAAHAPAMADLAARHGLE